MVPRNLNRSIDSVVLSSEVEIPPVGPVNPGTYDITTDSETTLMNVKRA